MSKSKQGVLPITDVEMTRFNISLSQGVEMVLWSLEHLVGGEVFIPKIPSYRIVDVAEAIGPSCRKQVVGIRPGEKVHEEMITSADSFSTYDMGSYFAILPFDGLIQCQHHELQKQLQKVPQGFVYNSGTNSEFLSVQQIRDLIKVHLDPNFEPL